MPLTITFQLTDRDLVHLGDVVNKAKANASSLGEADIIRAARESLKDAGKVEVADFIRERLDKLDLLVQMLEDKVWELSGARPRTHHQCPRLLRRSQRHHSRRRPGLRLPRRRRRHRSGLSGAAPRHRGLPGLLQVPRRRREAPRQVGRPAGRPISGCVRVVPNCTTGCAVGVPHCGNRVSVARSSDPAFCTRRFFEWHRYSHPCRSALNSVQCAPHGCVAATRSVTGTAPHKSNASPL